jgi:flavodoxin
MNRRTLMKGSLTLGAGAVLSAQLASCGSPPAPRPATSPAVAPEASTAHAPSKVLLAYFSRAGENYYYGDRITLEVGNTEVVANIIASTLTVDVYRIKAAEPYPASYDATVERNVREQDDEARPAIADRLPVLESYDTVLLGSPIWNVRPPMIMRTFVDSVDLRGKTMLPFVTYAVSGMGNAIDDYTRLCPQARIGEGLAVRGEEAQGARTAVQDWLEKTGLLAA